MAENDSLKSRILGRNAGGAILKLVVASIIVGAVFSFFGLSPRAFWSGIFSGARDVIAAIGDNVGEVVMTLGAYLLIGAAVVVPIWIVARLLARRK